jgi:hypothetical protein
MEVLYGTLAVARQADKPEAVVGAFVLMPIERSKRSPVARQGRKKSVGSRSDKRWSASSRGLWPAITFLPLDTGQINAVEDHGQVSRVNLEALAISTLGRKTEAAFFEPLVPDGITVAVPVEQLEPVAAFVAEDEEMSGQRISSEELANQLCQSVEAFTEVGVSGAEENADWEG